jgi:hypothetical protein
MQLSGVADPTAKAGPARAGDRPIAVYRADDRRAVLVALLTTLGRRPPWTGG